MKVRSLFVLTIMFVMSYVYLANAWTPVPVKDDPLVRMPGTQQDSGVTFQPPSYCVHCHGGYDETLEPFKNWIGSMMPG